MKEERHKFDLWEEEHALLSELPQEEEHNFVQPESESKQEPLAPSSQQRTVSAIVEELESEHNSEVGQHILVSVFLPLQMESLPKLLYWTLGEGKSPN